MIEKTTFSKKELQIELNKKYGIKVEKIEKINKGTANIFKIISNNEKFIVKEFQSKYSKENVLKEISAIEYLRKNSQVPLPIYLKNNNNELYFVHKGKMIVVQKFVEGQVFEKNKGNHEQILESARYLGLIIEGFKNYNIDDNISILDWYSNKEFEKANKKYDEILSKLDNSKISEKIKMDIIFKKELLVKLSKTINAEDIKNGYDTFKSQKSSNDIELIAKKYKIELKEFNEFVDLTVDRKIFDAEVLTDLLAPQELGWKERGKVELALMKELIPILKKMVDYQEISGLSSYEE